MKIFFRTDASLEIGTGHVVRCITLAKALKKNGAECIFICRTFKGHLIDKIKQSGFEVLEIIHSEKYFSKKNPYRKLKNLEWININWKIDSFQTKKYLSEQEADWLIIDHYGIDARWERAISAYSKKIMVIDDLANRKHICDLILDQNLVSNYKSRYKKYIPKNCTALLGPKYVLLQEDYGKLHKIAKIRRGPIKNILIYFGGINKNKIIEKTLSAFKKLNDYNFKLNVIIGANFHSNKKFFSLIDNSNIKIFKNLKSLAPLILEADLSIGACGTTSWERCCLGLPTIVFTVAENQKNIAKTLHEQRCILWCGHCTSLTTHSIYKILKKYLHMNFEQSSKACKNITDGSGTEMVSSIITLSSNTILRSRFANIKDETLLLDWANDDLVRKNSFNSKKIKKEIHHEWYLSKLKNPKTNMILIFETLKNIPIGQVRIEKKNRRWLIDFSLAKYARNKKIATKLLDLAIKKFKDKGVSSLYAEVKRNNEASKKVFEKSGFLKRLDNKFNFDTFYKKII